MRSRSLPGFRRNFVAAETRGDMAGFSDRGKRGPRFGTGSDGEATARTKRAALVKAGQVGWLALDGIEPRPPRAVEARRKIVRCRDD
jgi:hypothetical protein